VIPYGEYPDLSGVRRALVVKLRHHGDVLLASATFAALKRALPQAEIDAYIYRDTLPMLEGHPAITGFHLYDSTWKTLPAIARMSREVDQLRSIRAAGYDLAVNLTEGDRGAIAARVSGAAVRVGWDPEGTGLKYKHRLYTHITRRPKTPRHIVEQNLDCLRRIGIFPALEERTLHFHVPRAARAALEERLLAAGTRPGEFVLLHPTSRWLFKCWPVEQVARLIEALHAAGRRVVLSAAPDEREMAMVAALREICRAPLVDLAGRLDLKEVGALVEAASAVVCVDSLPLHLASALQRPCVVLFGPSSELVWGPWRNPRAIVVAREYSCRPCGLDGCGGSKVSDCLVTLPVEPVEAALRKLLQ
jgi:heptosyltransferase-3